MNNERVVQREREAHHHIGHNHPRMDLETRGLFGAAYRGSNSIR